MSVLEIVLAVLFLLVGVWSAFSSLRAGVEVGESAKVRALVALHDAAKAGFWLALGGLFVGFALIDDDQSFAWFAVVPIVMAGLRMLAAAQLSRR